jgi:hypothetical protein
MKTLKLIIGLLFASLLILASAALITITGLSPLESVGVSTIMALVLTGIEMKFKSAMPQGLAFTGVCGKISANVSRSCTNPLQAGTRDRGIIINFDDVLAPTYDTDGETVLDIILVSGAIAYQIDGQNNSIEPKSTMVEQGFNNMFDHEVMMKGFDVSPATKNQINKMKDGRFVVVTENYFRGVAGNAAFEVYGLTTGMEVTELERDANSEETQGAFHIKFFTKKNKEPKTANTWFVTDYAITKAAVDALLV